MPAEPAAAADGLPALDGVDDPTAGSPYLRRFERELAALTTRSCELQSLIDRAARSRLVLLGEYHPLPSACETAREILAHTSSSGRRVVLGLEMVHYRDQAALDAFMDGQIGEREFLERIRYREEWGYPWAGARALLREARTHGARVVGLDIPPRGSERDLLLRDRVAAERIAGLLAPGTSVVAIFGEAHLASAHLPREIERRAGRVSIVRVFHDVEIGESTMPAGVTRSGRHTFFRRCVPLGERARALARVYRRWAQDQPEPLELDVPLLIDEILDAHVAELRLDPRRTRMASGLWLADCYPLVFAPRAKRRALRLLQENGRHPRAARACWQTAMTAGAMPLAEERLMLVGRLDFQAMALACGRY
ncbi:MAG: ChaN family lipoprotein, partial [Acidobacteriota bacterium]